MVEKNTSICLRKSYFKHHAIYTRLLLSSLKHCTINNIYRENNTVNNPRSVFALQLCKKTYDRKNLRKLVTHRSPAKRSSLTGRETVVGGRECSGFVVHLLCLVEIKRSAVEWIRSFKRRRCSDNSHTYTTLEVTKL